MKKFILKFIIFINLINIVYLNNLQVYALTDNTKNTTNTSATATYTIKIPPYYSFGNIDVFSGTTTFVAHGEVIIEKYDIPDGKRLVVKAGTDGINNDSLTLSDGSTTIPYIIQSPATVTIAAGSTIITLPSQSGITSIDCNLVIAKNDIHYAHTFSGSIHFYAYVEDIT